MRNAAPLLALAIVTLMLYTWRLADAPVHLAHDEVLFALNARSIATTAHDLNGLFLPLYPHVEGNYYLTPLTTADYLGDYRTRSSVWFERNIRGAMEVAIAQQDRQPAAALYLSTTIPWTEYYWRFYLLKHDRQELLQRTQYVSPDALDVYDMRASSMVVSAVEDRRVMALAASGELRKIAVITEPNDTPSFVVLQR